MSCRSGLVQVAIWIGPGPEESASYPNKFCIFAYVSGKRCNLSPPILVFSTPLTKLKLHLQLVARVENGQLKKWHASNNGI